MANYVATFKQLQLELGTQRLDDTLARDIFLRGLKSTVQHWVMLQRPDTFDEACQLADRADASV